MTRRKHKIQVPVGVEKLLYLAAQDEDFKARLLADPAPVASEVGIELRPSEAAMLRAIDPAALEVMIASLVPQNPRRRKFMRLVAAATTSLAAGTVVASCGGSDVQSRGITPDTEVDGGTDIDAGPDADIVDTDTWATDVTGATADKDVDGEL